MPIDYRTRTGTAAGHYGGPPGMLPPTRVGQLPSTQIGNPPPPGGVPQSPMGNMNWRNFTFQNPTSPFQQNFNALYAQNPDAAFSYGFNTGNRPGGAADSNALVEAMNARYGNGIGQGLISAYGGGPFSATSQQGRSLGVPADWSVGRGGFATQAGQGWNYGGQTYNLANQVNTGVKRNFFGRNGPDGYSLDPATAAMQRQNDGVTGWNQGGNPIRTPTQSAGPGSPAWWAAVQGKPAPATPVGPPAGTRVISDPPSAFGFDPFGSPYSKAFDPTGGGRTYSYTGGTQQNPSTTGSYIK